MLAKLRGPQRAGGRVPVASARVVATAPAAATTPASALLGDYANAGGQAEARNAAVALRRSTCPAFASALDGGETVAEALLGSDPEIGDLLSTPDAVATLAMAATDFFGACEPDAVAAVRREARQRAFDLLADALEIVGKA